MIILLIPFMIVAYGILSIANSNWLNRNFKYNEYNYICDKDINGQCS